MRIALLAMMVAAALWGCGTEAHIDEAPTDATLGQSTLDDSAFSTIFTLAPSAVTLPAGSQASVTASFSGGPGVSWTLSTVGLPAGVKATFSSPTLVGGQSVKLTLKAAASATVGAVTVSVEAVTAKGAKRTAALDLNVVPSGAGGGGGGGGIGPTGGTVDLLRFATTGDTRPPACEDHANYPTGIINGIVDGMITQSPQFALDLGDHMYVCNNSLAEATLQMNQYMQSIQRFPEQWFMTMGNHECWHGPCLPGSTNANYVAFMSALAPVSSLPYYAFNVQTRLGLATFIVLADNSWDSAQAAWFEQQMATADTAAKYTIVARHHPVGDTSVTTNKEAVTILRRHKFALFLTGHAHSYSHPSTDNGRDVVIGIGGAPLLAAGSDFNGYAMVEQQPAGELRVSVYSTTGNTLHETFTVGPNQ
jgi:Calcineurin-like phosphoesterase